MNLGQTSYKVRTFHERYLRSYLFRSKEGIRGDVYKQTVNRVCLQTNHRRVNLSARTTNNKRP